jgi:DNA-binding transcriptional MocR family regulator
LEQSQEDTDKRTPYPFNAMTPDPTLIPYREYQHCLDQAINRYKKTLFQYSDTRGLDDLQNILQVHLSQRQIFCDREQIVMTTGSQQALTLIVQLLHSRTGKGVLMEQPSYGVFRDFIALQGIPVGGFRRSQKGIDFNALKKQFRNWGLQRYLYYPEGPQPIGNPSVGKG